MKYIKKNKYSKINYMTKKFKILSIYNKFYHFYIKNNNINSGFQE